MIIKEVWQQMLNSEFDKLYFKRLWRWLKKERQAGKQIFPSEAEYFQALNYSKPHQVKVVIVGQDPYHTPGYANGYAFSVPIDKGKPPSLLNIFKELKTDLGPEIPNHGDLTKWATQGVLLLNSTLSVEAGRPGSHRNLGWERFTDRIIELLNFNKDPIVFMLWGRDAQAKKDLITNPKHLVLRSSHPSPFSAAVKTTEFGAFFGSKPFSTANNHLIKFDRHPIDWTIPNRV